MSAWGIKRGHLAHSLLVAAIVFAFVLRALIPTGWMPSAAGSGQPLVLCTAQGPQILNIEIGGKPTAPSKHQSHEFCVYAGNATANAPHGILPATQPFLLEAVVVFARMYAQVLHAVILTGSGGPRAPPSTL